MVLVRYILPLHHAATLYFLIPDIDECAMNNGGCQYSCTNTFGSFMCSCNVGYDLLEDSVTCQGMNE